MHIGKDRAIAIQRCFLHPQIQLPVGMELLIYKYFHSLTSKHVFCQCMLKLTCILTFKVFEWCYPLSKINEILKVLSSFVALHEVGGVPFEILEPVLTRCTPEQLLRIEECNPVISALLNSGDHGGHEASPSACLVPFVIKFLHGLYWFSILNTYFFEFSCHYQAFLSQVLGFKAFCRIITLD